MKRREFIELAAAGAAGLVLPAVGLGFSPAPPAPGLLQVLHDERIVRDIGQRYREMMPAEDDSRVLAQAILEQPSGTVAAALGARIDQQVRRDFAAGRTVKVDGWVLSVTEARQCALYSLQQA